MPFCKNRIMAHLEAVQILSNELSYHIHNIASEQLRTLPDLL